MTAKVLQTDYIYIYFVYHQSIELRFWYITCIH